MPNIGDFCLLDNENKGKLDTSDATIVKIKEKTGLNTYLVEEVDCSINPTLKPNTYVVKAKYLLPINKLDNVAIRFPVSMPPVSDIDLAAMERIISNFYKGKNIDANDITRLQMVYTKFKFYQQMFDL